MSSKKKAHSEKTASNISVASVLSGTFSALLGVEFGLYLAAEDGQKISTKMAMISDRFTPSQKRMAELVKTTEIKLKAAQYDEALKTCRLMNNLLKELFRKIIPASHVYLLVSHTYYRLMVHIGDSLFNQGHSKDALAFYQELLTYFPEDINLLKKAARINYTMGFSGLPEAERLYRQALQADPADLETYENIGRILNVLPDRQKDARFAYREAMQYCQTDMDRIRFYLLLMKIDTADPNIPLRIGRLYQRMGMFIEARKYLETAYELNPNGWAALDLAYLSLTLQDLQRAGELLFSSTVEEDLEQAHTRYYYLALYHEEMGSLQQAYSCLDKIPAESPVYWKAALLRARLVLQDGNPFEAASLVEKIPENQRQGLGWAYIEMCQQLETSWKTLDPDRSEHWREKTKSQEPNYLLWKDIKKRSMGTGFWRKYEALEILGSGPSGQVWLGRDRYKGQTVAIKKLAPFFLQDPAVLRRIQGHLRSWRGLDSPRLIPVYEECYYNGHFFYAVKYQTGHTLKDIIRSRAPLPVVEAAGLMLQVCNALNDLQRQIKNMSHGNLKPENIFLSPDASVILADFDLLWAIEGSKVFSGKFLKEHPRGLRSFLYAAPERFDVKGMLNGLWGKLQPGDNMEMAVHGVDHRADLFSLGVIFFELVTGFLPIRKPTIKSLLSFHRTRSLPSPRQLNPTLPLELEDIILRLMAKDPYHRFNSPLEAAQAIKKAKIY